MNTRRLLDVTLGALALTACEAQRLDVAVPDRDALIVADAGTQTLDAGATDALLLTGKPTAETGRVRFFQMVGDKLSQSDRPMGRKEPADLRPRAGMVLVFTPRTLPPRARVVSTFRTEAK